MSLIVLPCPNTINVSVSPPFVFLKSINVVTKRQRHICYYNLTEQEDKWNRIPMSSLMFVNALVKFSMLRLFYAQRFDHRHMHQI